MHDQLWVEPVGELILARMRGEPTVELLRSCHEQVLALIRDTGKGKVLYDALELMTPPVEVTMSQWALDEELKGMSLRRAIVVPNTKLAYLARIAFAQGEHKVFYNDIVAAINWLNT